MQKSKIINTLNFYKVSLLFADKNYLLFHLNLFLLLGLGIDWIYLNVCSIDTLYTFLKLLDIPKC